MSGHGSLPAVLRNGKSGSKMATVDHLMAEGDGEENDYSSDEWRPHHMVEGGR